jgi:paraquat-inducible protein B
MRPAALRVGLFTLAGLVLLGLALATAGGRWFTAKERAVMRFQTSVYGLQVGAPVVLRGVQVGQVIAIGLAPGGGASGTSGIALPVTAEFDAALLRPLLQAPADASATATATATTSASTAAHDAAALPALIARGLVARLATQSLLTGLLYVDLDLAPPTSASAAAPPAAAGRGLPQNPTAPTPQQTLQAQLEGLDLGQIGRDLAAVAAATRELLAAPGAREALGRTADAAQAVQQLARALQRDAGPLARSVEDTLAQARRAVAQVEPLVQAATPTLRGMEQAASQVGAAASQVGGAADEARALAQAARPLVGDLRRSADELSRAAATLREATAPESPVRRQTETALQEISRAAVALRELATLLEQHPSAIVWGRPKNP